MTEPQTKPQTKPQTEPHTEPQTEPQIYHYYLEKNQFHTKKLFSFKILFLFVEFFSLGPLEEIETILSGLEYRNSSDGKPFYYKARGLMNIWALKNNATRQQGRNDVDEIAMDWEEVKNIYS